VQRDDDKIPRGSRRGDQWKELGCRNCTHSGIFDLCAVWNKAKGVKNDEIQMTNDDLMTKPE